MPPDASRFDPASEARSTLAALGQLRTRAAPAPEALCQRARALLDERFGPTERPAAEGFARGATGLLGEHTHYADGFAVLMPMAQGTAVATRPASAPPSRLAVEGEEAVYALRPDASGAQSAGQPAKVRAASAVIRALAPGPVEAAVASAVPPACFDARLAALGGAAARALEGLAGEATAEKQEDAAAKDRAAEWEHVRALVAEGADVPFSLAYLLAAAEGDPPHWLLADTAAREHLPVEAPPADELGRGLVVVRSAAEAGAPEGPAQASAFHHKRRQQAEDALRVLRSDGGFAGLASFRDLEHRDLDRALRLLPPDLQPLVRHLISENRRVQKLVRAARQGDWQFFGALLLMSHASLQNDWQSTAAPLDAVVSAAEETDAGGLYGACMTGRGSCVLVVGRPAAFPAFFRRAAGVLREQFGLEAETMLL